jgi:2-polyprenyl-6-methoxyphenol hydroxylase-like FAD-dependent oxidoreductase
VSAIKLKVLISGAGIAGPCLAFWLAKTRLDTSIMIVERSPTPRVTGQSIDIRGPAIEIIKKMKPEEAIHSGGTTEEGTTFLNFSGMIFAQFDADESFTAEYEILKADLAGLFLEATEGLGNVQYIYGNSIKGLEQTDRDIHVTFASGLKDTFDLVAADGSTSKTRSMILDEQVLKDSYNFLG